MRRRIWAASRALLRGRLRPVGGFSHWKRWHSSEGLEDDQAAIEQWCDENCGGPWFVERKIDPDYGHPGASLTIYRTVFYDARDAVAFSLVNEVEGESWLTRSRTP